MRLPLFLWIKGAKEGGGCEGMSRKIILAFVPGYGYKIF